jgi:hypothetical protein
MKDGIKAKRPGYIKFYPERWIFGSTREELTNAERAVWMDFLALAYLNDPPGQVDFTSFRRLARQLFISEKLLITTVKKSLLNAKIKLILYSADPKSGEKVADSELNCDQVDSKLNTFDATRSKIGITLYTLFILRWNEYQGEYLRQKPYREAKPKGGEKPQKLGPELCNSGYKQRRGGENEVSPNNKGEEYSGFPSHPRDQFLYILKEFSEEYPYPFDERADGQVFDLCVNECPSVDPIKETEKKIAYWKQNPGALRSRGKGPRAQLLEFFEAEENYQTGKGKMPCQE